MVRLRERGGRRGWCEGTVGWGDTKVRHWGRCKFLYLHSITFSCKVIKRPPLSKLMSNSASSYPSPPDTSPSKLCRIWDKIQFLVVSGFLSITISTSNKIHNYELPTPVAVSCPWISYKHFKIEMISGKPMRNYKDFFILYVWPLQSICTGSTVGVQYLVSILGKSLERFQTDSMHFKASIYTRTVWREVEALESCPDWLTPSVQLSAPSLGSIHRKCLWMLYIC